jgi:hypothetical protein
MESSMLSFATVRPLSEAKRARMALPPLPSNLLRLIQRAAHAAHEVCEACKKAELSAHHTTTVTISAMNTHE